MFFLSAHREIVNGYCYWQQWFKQSNHYVACQPTEISEGYCNKPSDARCNSNYYADDQEDSEGFEPTTINQRLASRETTQRSNVLIQYYWNRQRIHNADYYSRQYNAIKPKMTSMSTISVTIRRDGSLRMAKLKAFPKLDISSLMRFEAYLMHTP